MKTEHQKWLNANCHVAPSSLPGDDGQAYLSKVDDSYAGRVGMEDDNGLLDFFIEHGISELQADTGDVACLGFSAAEQQWYGWSHRAIYGFEVGSEVKRGDCGYKPTNEADFNAEMLRFWSDDYHKEMRSESQIIDGQRGVYVSWGYTDDVPNKSLPGTRGGCFSAYPDDFGRGEWTAESLEDAKQMARDFASGVS